MKTVKELIDDIVVNKINFEDLEIIRQEIIENEHSPKGTYDIVAEYKGIQVYKGHYSLGIKFNNRGWLEVFRDDYLQVSGNIKGHGSYGTSDLIRFYQIESIVSSCKKNKSFPEECKVFLCTTIFENILEQACENYKEFNILKDECDEILDLFIYSIMQYYNIPFEYFNKDIVIDSGNYGYELIKLDGHNFYTNGVEYGNKFIPIVYLDNSSVFTSLLLLHNITNYMHNVKLYTRLERVANMVTLNYPNKSFGKFYINESNLKEDDLKLIFEKEIPEPEHVGLFSKKPTIQGTMEVYSNEYIWLLKFTDKKYLIEKPKTFVSNFNPFFTIINIFKDDYRVSNFVFESFNELVETLDDSDVMMQYGSYFYKWYADKVVNTFFDFIYNYEENLDESNYED